MKIFILYAIIAGILTLTGVITLIYGIKKHRKELWMTSILVVLMGGLLLINTFRGQRNTAVGTIKVTNLNGKTIAITEDAIFHRDLLGNSTKVTVDGETIIYSFYGGKDD